MFHKKTAAFTCGIECVFSTLVMHLRSRLAGIFLLVVGGCAGAAEEPAAHGSAVVGGREARDGEWPSVVHIGKKKSNGDIKFGCTGTLVSPTHVLTAAHCIERVHERECLRPPPRPGGIGNDILTYAEEYEPATSFVIKDPADPSKRVAVIKAWAHPRFRDDMVGWADAALLELAEPIANVTPIPPLLDWTEVDQALRVGQKATLVGYGKTSLFDEDGEKRKAHVGEVSIRRFDSAEVDLGGGETVSGSPGDSGGPSFVKLANGEWRQLGITSRGPQDFGVSPIAAIYGRVDAIACDLQSASGVTFTAADCSAPTAVGDDGQTFGAICANAGATRDQQHTVRVLLGLAGTTDCAAAERVLRERTELDLASKRIRDVTPLVGLDALTALSLDYNDVTTIAPLARLPALTTLRLGWNDVRDFSPLPARVRVLGKRMQRATYKDTDFYRLCKNPSSATPEQQATVSAIERFFWHPDDPPGASDLCDVANRELVVTRSLTVASPKWNATNRVTCEVEQTFPARAVRDVSPLAGLLALESVNLAKDEDVPNDVSDVRPLATLENLKELDLTGNPVTDVTPLDALVRDNGLTIKR